MILQIYRLINFIPRCQIDNYHHIWLVAKRQRRPRVATHCTHGLTKFTVRPSSWAMWAVLSWRRMGIMLGANSSFLVQLAGTICTVIALFFSFSYVN
jgi:hypothetical protein